MSKIVYVTWMDFDNMINRLEKEIRLMMGRIVSHKFDGIYGIPKGGLPIAVCLSHRLNLPLLLYPTDNTLLVDDISDIGKTSYSFKRKLFCTLFTTKWTTSKPDIALYEKKKMTDWIVFPWEEK